MTDANQPLDMNAILQQAQQMGEQLMAAQQEAAAEIHEGQAGGGAVKIQVTGGLQFLSVTIAPEAVDPNDVEMLQDLVLAALNDAVSHIGDDQADGLDLGDLDLGGLLGGEGGLGGLLGPGGE
ncbi:MAG: YbaB/EbfC family nucleoid-associated protein [Acidimicrobiales bacterium]